jgi:hypothetical protein
MRSNPPTERTATHRGEGPTAGRLEAWLLAGLFLVMIAVPLVAFVAGIRPAPNQNRPPTPLPRFTLDGVLDRKLTPQLDAYLEDALVIAPGAVAAEAWADLRLGDSPSDQVTLGNSGWLYYTFSLTRPCLDPDQVATFVDAVGRAERAVAATGRELLVAIAPDKATIVPDFLPADSGDCDLQVADALNALEGPDGLVTVWDEMRTARARPRPVYFRLDTHWTNEGASVMAEALVDELNPGAWDPEAVREVARSDHEGDLTVLLGLPSSEPAYDLETQLPGATATRVTRPLLTAAGAEYEKAVAVDFSGESIVPGHTLVMHDSYGWALTPMLAPYFESATFINETDPASGHMAADLTAADVVIYEIVQRSLHETILQRDLAAGFVAAWADEFDVVASGAQQTGDHLELSPGGDDRYVVVDLAPGTESAEVAYHDTTAKLNADSPRAGYYVGAGGTMYFAGEVEYRIVTVND